MSSYSSPLWTFWSVTRTPTINCSLAKTRFSFLHHVRVLLPQSVKKLWILFHGLQINHELLVDEFKSWMGETADSVKPFRQFAQQWSSDDTVLEGDVSFMSDMIYQIQKQRKAVSLSLLWMNRMTWKPFYALISLSLLISSFTGLKTVIWNFEKMSFEVWVWWWAGSPERNW